MSVNRPKAYKCSIKVFIVQCMRIIVVMPVFLIENVNEYHSSYYKLREYLRECCIHFVPLLVIYITYSTISFFDAKSWQPFLGMRRE